MPQLQHHGAARRMHGIGDLAPAGHLFGVVDAWRAGVALALGRDLGALGDDHARAGALAVILHHQGAGHVAGVGPAARERRHDDAVAQLQGAELRGAVQVRAPGVRISHEKSFLGGEREHYE